MKTYVLDACAVVALFNDEEGADVVDNLIVEAKNDLCTLIINKYNLLEVYYGYMRVDGEAYAEQQLLNVRKAHIRIADTLNDKIFRQAARLKTHYKISLADSIVLAQATVDNAIVVTSDHHELNAVDRDGKINFLWIR